jgi:dTDP-4-dehydrorhamnose reductase
LKILITSKSGQLAQSIRHVVNNSKIRHKFIFVDRKTLDFSQPNSIESFFCNHNFDLIINCAAYTAVDKAESEKKLVNQINHLAVKQIAEISNKKQIKLIHISTDYVFNGKGVKPYTEEDLEDPINTYGISKLKGEKAVQEAMLHNAIIIRTSWLFSEYGNNFVKTILKLSRIKNKFKIVSDQVGSPTYAYDLAEVIINIIQNKSLMSRDYISQIYHYSNTGQCSWYDFSKEIIKLSKSSCNIEPISTESYLTEAKRPKFTALNTDRISSLLNINIPHWQNSLNLCLQRIQKIKD